MDQDDDNVLDIDGAIPEEGDEKIPDGFHATDPETGLPIPGEDDDLDEDEDEDESF